MARDRTQVWIWLAVLGVFIQSSQCLGWGSSSCSLKQDDLRKLEALCTKTAEVVNASVANLEQKLERVLTFVEEMKKHENAWIEESSTSNGSKGTVERDVSTQEAVLVPSVLTNTPTQVESADVQGQESQNSSYRNIQTTRFEDDDDEDSDNGDEEEEDDQEVKKETLLFNIPSSTSPTGECEVQVIDNHETIGMFYMTSFRHGHCANRHPVTSPIRHCLGYCATRTYIEREAGIWSQGNRCSSCQVDKLETLKIPLACDDGFTFEKAFENVVSCRCQACKPVKE
ncbi:uncharacterized protein LOC125046829 isoform X1 [Penaeus chinensis]|uniref:uncharacterized protein LOC125046829 isoform X1 n=1 Tax=Penaeus chinensis TaxID=139456 RepID=UPI001FB7326C|nr:uncharacterized protein LOC125046829 isoform X1 [Penaeus chinensis]XP_047500757.1 uncharacterized protein LOC125046829 isoform X1 [Penaeus chinensis]